MYIVTLLFLHIFQFKDETIVVERVSGYLVYLCASTFTCTVCVCCILLAPPPPPPPQDDKRGLGLSIAGGSDNPHVMGDNGVFVTKLISESPAEKCGLIM